MKAVAFVVPLVVALGLLPAAASAQESQLDSLRAAAKASATNPSAALALGRALRRAGHTVDALNELRRGINLSVTHPDALVPLHWEVARVFIDRHEFPQATTECKVLGALPGAGADGPACAADALLMWQRANEALPETAAALQKDPHHYEAKVAEGRAYDQALDATKAEASLRAAIATRADGVDAHLALGRVLLKGGHKDDGIAELRKALQLDPNGPDALYELGVALAPSGESVTDLGKATAERPTFADAWLALGIQQLAGGHVADAKKAAEAAVQQDGRSAGPHMLAGKVALAEGRADDAIREAEAALKIVGNTAPAKLLIADANAKKGEIDVAIEAYQAAWGFDHGDPTPLVHAAEACHAAGRDTSAQSFGEKATHEFPKWGPAWVALGDALVARGEKQKARDAYQKSLSGDGPVDKDAVQKKLAAIQ
jgi:tetratricopeptide (TPR) repeat protein